MGRLDDLVLIGDEAYTREELERLVSRRDRERVQARKYRSRPDVKERRRARHKEWVDRNRDRVRAYNTAWHRANRSRYYSDEELRDKIEKHQRFVDRYQAELRRRDSERAA